ncbi:hypothetical protein ACSLNK_29275, partial [Escherichia coli]
GAGMSTVRTAIARLEAEGWLTRKARRQGNRNASNVYQLNVAKRPDEKVFYLTDHVLILLTDPRQILTGENPLFCQISTHQI